MSRLVEVEPKKLTFERPGNSPRGGKLDSLRQVIAIKGVQKNGVVAFKLQTNASKRFNVQPAQGYLAKGESRKVTVQLKHGAGWAESDKFLIRAVAVENDERPIQLVWEGKHDDVEKVVVRCEYLASESIGPTIPDPALSSVNNNTNSRAQPVLTRSPKNIDEFKPSVRVLQMLRKNLSTRSEDRLSEPELEELVKIRNQIGLAKWEELQREAQKQADSLDLEISLDRSADRVPTSRHNRESPTNIFPSSSRPSSPPTLIDPFANVDYSNHSTEAAQPSTASFSELLANGVAGLRDKRVEESMSSFQQALQLAPPGRVERAQVLVGLGSAFEAGGLLDRALDCYVDSLKLYDRLNEKECKESVANAIAHLYSDMRDHTMSAAWFDYQLNFIDTEPGNGIRRSKILDARQHQIKLGHVTPALLAAGRGRIASMLSTRPTAARAQEQELSVSSTPAIPKSNGIESFWEPPSSNRSIPSGSISSSQQRDDYLRDLDETPFVVPSGQVKLRKRMSTGSGTTTTGPNGAPHYLSATTASRASRVPANLNGKGGGLDNFGDSLESNESDSASLNVRASSYVNPEVVEKRNRQAAALHVRRALQARRIKDQSKGIRPPLVKKNLRQSSEGVSIQEQSDQENAKDNLVVVLEVMSQIDGMVYSVALPGPLSKAQNLTIREMRERVSFVTGVELHDFELVVENTPLLDSWIGQDIGLANQTEVELRLLPGVRPSKYIQQPLKSPHSSASGRDFDEGRFSSFTSPSNEPIPAPPKRKPPPPVLSPDDSSNSPIYAPNFPPEFNFDNFAGEEMIRNASAEASLDEDEISIAQLCSTVQSSLEEQKKALRYADEMSSKAIALLQNDERIKPEGSSQNTESNSGTQSNEKLGEYAASLVEKIMLLEKGLAEKERTNSSLQEELEVAKEAILALTTQIQLKSIVEDKLEYQVGSVKAEFLKARNEMVAMLKNYGEYISSQMKQIIPPDLQMGSVHARSRQKKFAFVVDQEKVSFLSSTPSVNQVAMLRWDDEAELSPSTKDEVHIVVGEPSQVEGDRWPYFELDYIIGTENLHEDSEATAMFEAVRDEFVNLTAATTYLVNFGQPVFFQIPGRSGTQEQGFGDPLSLVQQVSMIIESFPSNPQVFKVRAVALPINAVFSNRPSNGQGIVDLLDPKQNVPDDETQKKVTITLNEEKQVWIQNAVAVKFRSQQDFLKLHEVLATRVKAAAPGHFVFSLENESSGNRVVFVQIHESPEGNDLAELVLQGCGETNSCGQTFVVLSTLTSDIAGGVCRSIQKNISATKL